jgi:Fic family protein
MSWNWQIKEWPGFTWNKALFLQKEQDFIENCGLLAGATRHINLDEQAHLSVELLSQEAMDTSEIEGEYLNRDSVHSSIKHELGLKAALSHTGPAEVGIAKMLVDLYQTNAPITGLTLFKWHSLLMNGRQDLGRVGAFRTHVEPMQIVSGPDYKRTIHFEAPPSVDVLTHMQVFLKWLSDTRSNGTITLPHIVRAGIAHLWFESIHPFEDGNGRIGRAISEKILAESSSQRVITALAKTLLAQQKNYYQQLGKASQSLEITPWLLWFSDCILDAQRASLKKIDFIIQKTKMLDTFNGQLNVRQEKTLIRMFKEGVDGFKGGLSAANYISITGTTTATATRDLSDLVSKGALRRVGAQKSTRYFLCLYKKE